MSRIATRFTALRQQHRRALIPYLCAGDPSPALTVPLLHALVAAGADILELGVPFSDPMADGPVIQRATERALRHGVRLSDVLAMVRTFREQDTATPVVLMGYLNPVEAMGYDTFATQAAAVGVDGALIVDAPPEEAGDLAAALRTRGLDLIYLIAPTSTSERIARICQAASGFVYYVSVKGVTGSGQLDTDAVAARLAEIRTVTDLPLGVGFGIKDADSAMRVAQVADAVIVGSALVSRIETRLVNPLSLLEDLPVFLKGLRHAVDAGYPG